MTKLLGLATRLWATPPTMGRHRTDNRTGHYTLDGVTRSLRNLVVHGTSWAVH
jgi:hypothetical protein